MAVHWRRLQIGSILVATSLLLTVSSYSQPTSASATQIQLNATASAQTRLVDNPGYDVNCVSTKSREDDDLCQQRRMAKAAEDSVWWARLQTWIGIFGAIGLAATLFFTGRATSAASRQVRLSRQALVDTDRAFVFVSEGLMGPVVDSKTDKVIAWKTSVRWKNFGTTPTRNLRLHIACGVFDADLPDDFVFPVPPVPDVHVMIAPGGTIDSVELPIELEIMDDVVSGKKLLYAWGWAEYDDVFDKTPRHRTEFCYRWTVGGNIRDPKKFGSRYNVYQRHNGADEECEHKVITASPKNPA